MNRYPLWKYILIIAVVTFGLVFALPNLFPSQPAVQITATQPLVQPMDSAALEKIKKALSAKDLSASGVELIGQNKALIRFDTPDTQLAAVEAIKDSLGNNYSTALNLAPATPTWLRALKPMSLGLDLRGGVHFLMKVDMESAIDNSLTRHRQEFRSFLRKNAINYKKVNRVADHLIVQFDSADNRDKARKELKSDYRNEIEFIDIKTSKGPALKASLTESNINNTKSFALQQNITTLRSRVNDLGVAEPIIQQQGLERIVVQLPGMQDPEVARMILGTTATLEFRMVNSNPAESKLFTMRDGSTIRLDRKIMLTGKYITDATAGRDSRNNTPNVSIVLDGKGAKLFHRATKENVGKPMGVVFIEHKTDIKKLPDGSFETKAIPDIKVINVATIQEPLSKNFQITGLQKQESYELALKLRAGALAAPVYIVEERTIGPSLGAENIIAGFKSVVIGFVLVLIFMAFYYRVFGLVANLALTLNLVLIIAVLSVLQASLTLPGIAGIVLTVGMAVDANVLIYERIKEELRNGVTPQAAISAGYEKAFSTIADANITTFIAALVLFWLGTGPIKGFAITLAIGIVSSMFTAIMGTRAVINLIYGGKKHLKKLAI